MAMPNCHMVIISLCFALLVPFHVYSEIFTPQKNPFWTIEYQQVQPMVLARSEIEVSKLLFSLHSLVKPGPSHANQTHPHTFKLMDSRKNCVVTARECGALAVRGFYPSGFPLAFHQAVVLTINPHIHPRSPEQSSLHTFPSRPRVSGHVS